MLIAPKKLVRPEAGQAFVGLFFIGITSEFGPNPYRGFAVAFQVVPITKQSPRQTFRTSDVFCFLFELSGVTRKLEVCFWPWARTTVRFVPEGRSILARHLPKFFVDAESGAVSNVVFSGDCLHLKHRYQHQGVTRWNRFSSRS